MRLGLAGFGGRGGLRASLTRGERFVEKDLDHVRAVAPLFVGEAVHFRDELALEPETYLHLHAPIVPRRAAFDKNIRFSTTERQATLDSVRQWDILKAYKEAI